MMDKNEVAVEIPKSQDAGVGSTNKEINRPQSLEIPQTLELRQHGYLAVSSSRWDSGVYESPKVPNSLASQASDGFDPGFDYLGRSGINHIAAAAAAAMGDDISGFRQSSIDNEPQTLPVISVRQAQNGAVEIIETYDQADALHLFLKDAEDERLRAEALAAILPTAELGAS